jgi:hypothetical protein
MTKVFVVLTSVLSIVVSCLVVAFAAQVENWKHLSQEYQAQRDRAVTLQQSAQAAAQAALVLKDQALGDRGAELRRAQDGIERLGKDLSKVRSDATKSENERLAAEAGRTKLLEMLDVQSRGAEALQAQNRALLTETIDLRSRHAKANTRVLELTTNVTILTEQIRNMQEKLAAAERQLADAQRGGRSARPAPNGERLAAGVVPATAVPPRGELRGQITDVRGGYASINIGETSGVVLGMSFMIYRDANYLGELLVERVEPKQAGGRITSAAAGEVRSGDQVVFGLN